jgi:hypothetical protein
MRQRPFRALVLSCLLVFSLSSIPLTAAPRDRDGGDGRDLPGLARLIKQIKRVVTILEDTLTLPKP